MTMSDAAMDETKRIEAEVVLALATKSYDQIHREMGLSRGRIYSIALKYGARKNEARIREKAADRKRRQRETLEALIDTTATADVLDYLGSLPDGCAALQLFSPPYNVGKSYGENASADAMRHVTYMGWLTMIVSEAARTLAPGGVLALQVGSTRDHLDQIVPIDMLVHDIVMKTGLSFQNRVIWHVPHGLTPKRRLAGRTETVLIYSNGPPAHFHPNAAREPQKQPSKRAFKGPAIGRLSGHPLGAFPSDVWRIANVGSRRSERTGHPAQMPLELARRVIQLYTVPGELVVDPFSGSGTTHVACVETGRRFSGCDLIYDDMRARRLAKAGLADTCPLPGVSDESVAVWQAEAVRRDHEPAPRQMDLLSAA